MTELLSAHVKDDSEYRNLQCQLEREVDDALQLHLLRAVAPLVQLLDADVDVAVTVERDLNTQGMRWKYVKKD